MGLLQFANKAFNMCLPLRCQFNVTTSNLQFHWLSVSATSLNLLYLLF